MLKLLLRPCLKIYVSMKLPQHRDLYRENGADNGSSSDERGGGVAGNARNGVPLSMACGVTWPA